MMAKNHHPEILNYLHRDPLKNIVPLKVLSTYGEHVQSFYFSEGVEDGVLFLLPTKVTTYESVKYPETEFVVYVTAVSPTITTKMLTAIPTHCNLILKFTSAQDRAVFKQHMPLERFTSFLSYTSAANAQFSSAQEVIISDKIDQKLLPLYHQNGYESAEIESYFTTGNAISFAVFENGEPVSTCLAYQNYGRIWEIGMVYTVPQARRKGYAQKVVETALSLLLENGRIPRYQMDEKNTPSKQMAERLGLNWFLTTAHYLYHHKE